MSKWASSEQSLWRCILETIQTCIYFSANAEFILVVHHPGQQQKAQHESFSSEPAHLLISEHKVMDEFTQGAIGIVLISSVALLISHVRSTVLNVYTYQKLSIYWNAGFACFIFANLHCPQHHLLHTSGRSFNHIRTTAKKNTKTFVPRRHATATRGGIIYYMFRAIVFYVWPRICIWNCKITFFHQQRNC